MPITKYISKYIKSGVNTMAKIKNKVVDNSRATTEKAATKVKKSTDKGIMFGILGIAVGLVFVSNIYAITVILLGTDGLVPKIMITPMAMFDLAIMGVAFYKLFK